MKKSISVLLCMLLMLNFIPCVIINAANVNGKTITSKGACVMDYETGDILYEHNGNQRRVPASMTKIMNMYVIYEALAKGEITLNTLVPISKNVYDKSRNSVYQSVLPLYYNTDYTVNEMIDVIVVYSASGAAVAMAELIGGTEAAYVERMNNTAKKMGIDAVYYDSCGIADNEISPIGMAKLARNIIKDYPDILKRSSKSSVNFHGNRYKTTNHLLDTYFYEGADGLKTGTTSAAGYCFCGTAVRNGRRIITVTMSSASTGERFVDTAKLLDYGFSVKPESKENVYFTDMSTFINGYEVPTFAYKGKNDESYAAVIAEDLVNYGFDVNYNSNSKTLYLIYNENKKVNPMPINYYKNRKDELAYTVQENDISVVINDGSNDYNISKVHNLNGYMCISVDEFSKIFNFKWDNNSSSARITIDSKKKEEKPVVTIDDNSVIYFTNVSTFINDYEVPTFMFKGNNSHAVIVAEDLLNYGFDVNYDSNSKTLYLTYNENKKFNQMPINYYKGKKDEIAYNIYPSNVKVVLNDGVNSYSLKDIHDVNGYMCISVDEFGKIFDFKWDNNSFSSKINISSKKKEEKPVVAVDDNSVIYFTNISTFINDYEVPTFMFKGNNSHAVVIAEDLANYGFDVNYNNEEKTLNLTYNKDKKITPIPINYYKNKKDEIAYNIINNKINVNVDGQSLKDIYNVDGYVCISIDELGNLYKFKWYSENYTAYINIEEKEPESAILPNGSKLTSGSAYIMNYDTGEEMYSYKADEQKPVASIAKMMSVYVILDAIKNGEISLDTVVPISENVYNLSRVPDYKMMVNLEYDEKYTVDEMIDMIIIDSAAACVTAVAELISGSEKEFVKRMNKKASEIGINSVFYNGTGVCLNPQTDKENLMSAKEVAIMTRHMIQNYPDIVERTKCAQVEFHGQTYYNLNKMFTDFYYKGADGFKNGMTEASGYCMCGTAILDGKRVITVTLPSDSNQARFTDTAKMFDYGFSVLGVDTSDVYDVPDKSTSSEPEDNKPVDEIVSESININIDGNYEMKFKTAQPFISNEIVMVPLREMLEILEKKVEWNSETKEIVVSDDATAVYLKSDSDLMKVEMKHAITQKLISSEEINLNTPVITKNGVTFCPLAETLSAFGISCTFDVDNNQYLIIAGVC